MSMVVVEPDAIDVERLQNPFEIRHAVLAITRVERADTLPAFRRRRRLAVRSNRRGVGMVLEERRVVHRVELGEHLQPELVAAVDLLLTESARTDPHRVAAIA